MEMTRQEMDVIRNEKLRVVGNVLGGLLAKLVNVESYVLLKTEPLVIAKITKFELLVMMDLTSQLKINEDLLLSLRKSRLSQVGHKQLQEQDP